MNIINLNIIILIILIYNKPIYINSNLLTKHSQFHFTSNNPNYLNSIREFKLCFSGLSSITKFIELKDSKLDISQMLVNKAILAMYDSYIENTDLELITIQNNTSMFFKSNYFKKLEKSKYYCLYIYSKSIDIINAKNISIYSVSSTDENKFIYSSAMNFATVELYDLSYTDPALLIENSFSTIPDINNVYKDTSIQINFNIIVNLPENRKIYTSEDAYIVFELTGGARLGDSKIISEVTNSNNSNSSASQSLSKLKEGFKFEKIDNKRIILFNLSEDLSNNIRIALKLTSVIIISLDEINMSVKIIWRNTNSVISKHSIYLFTPNVYKFISKSIKISEDIPAIYTNSNFLLELKFISPINIDKEDIVVIYNEDLKVVFLPSTCDFSFVPSSKESYCKTFIDTSKNSININKDHKLGIYNLSIKAGLEVLIKFFIHTLSSGIPVFKLIIHNKTNFEIISHNINVNKAYINEPDSYLFNVNNENDKIYYSQCKNELSTNCINKLIVNENSGNFSLLESANNLGMPTLSDSDKVKKIEELSSSIYDSYFKLRTRYDFSKSKAQDIKYDYSLLSHAFAGDWVHFITKNKKINEDNEEEISFDNITESSFIFGKHRFYFPKQYYNVSSFSQCRLVWASSSQVYSKEGTELNEPKYSQIVKNVSDENRFNNYKKFIVNSNMISDNIISFDNYSANSVIVGVFHNLIQSTKCSDLIKGLSYYDSCKSNTDPLVINRQDLLLDLELTSNCAKYVKNIAFKSVFSNFNFFHTFTLKNSNTILRINRWISLLPQPGIFEYSKSETYSGGDSNRFIYKSYMFNIDKSSEIINNNFKNGNYSFMCLLSLELNSNYFYLGRYNNLLLAFLKGIELPYFENMNEYPISINSVKVNAISNPHITTKDIYYKNYFSYISYSENKYYKESEKIEVEENKFKIGNIIAFNNSNYSNYLGSVLSFSDLITGKYPNEYIYIPTLCTSFNLNKDEYSHYQISFSDIQLSNKEFRLVFPYKLTEHFSYSFIPKQYKNDRYLNPSILSYTGKYNLFENSKDNKLYFYYNKDNLNLSNNNTNDINENSINQQLNIYDTHKQKRNYAILLLNKIPNLYDFNIQNNSSFNLPKEDYQLIEIHNKITINSHSYKTMYIIIFKNKLQNIEGFENWINKDSNKAGFSFTSIPFQGLYAKVNDIAFYMGGEDKENNFMVTNYSYDKVSDINYYDIKNPDELTIENPEDLTLKIDYIDNSIVKNGDAREAVCLKIQIKLQKNMSNIEIYTPNLNGYTIVSTNNDYYSKVSPANIDELSDSLYVSNLIEYKNFNCFNKISFIYCSNMPSKQLKAVYICNASIANTKFQTNKISAYFSSSDTIKYITYKFNPPKEVNYATPSSQYEGAIFESYQYNTYEDNIFSEVELIVSIDVGVIRNMILEIVGGFYVWKINDSFIPDCSVYFYSDNQVENNIFESCNINFDINKITITTHNELYSINAIPKKFKIKFFPVRNLELSGIFVTNVYFKYKPGISVFNNEEQSPNYIKNKVPLNNFNIYKDKGNIEFSAIDISSNIKISDIQPTIPGYKGLYTISIDTSTNKEVINISSYLQDNNKLNEIMLYFPIKFYGYIPENLTITLNNNLIDNIKSLNNKIYIYTDFDLSLNYFEITIYGLIIPNEMILENKSLSYFIILIKKNNQTILKGSGNIQESLNNKSYSFDNLVKANLKIKDYYLSNYFPGSITDFTISFNIDNLGGANNFFPQINNLIDTQVYISLPEECIITNTSFVYLYEYKNSVNSSSSSNFNNPDKIAVDNSSDIELSNSVEYTLKDYKLIGNLILFTINTSVPNINESFKYWILKIKYIRLVDIVGYIGLIDITFLKKSNFILRTFPLLFNYYNSSRSLPIPYLFISNYRGIYLDYNNNFAYFTVSNNLKLKLGIYNEINVTANHMLSKPEMYETELSLGVLNKNLLSMYNYYLLDTKYRKSTTLYLGYKCSSRPGKYIIHINSSNTINFSDFPLIEAEVSDQKEKIKYFVLDENNPYKGDTVIIGRSSFVYFWLQPNMFNVDEITVKYTLDVLSGTTFEMTESEIYFPAYNVNNSKTSFYRNNILDKLDLSTNKYRIKYTAKTSSIDSKQSYNSFINNSCYEMEYTSIHFQANVYGETISPDFDIKKLAVFNNAESNRIKSFPYNSIEITINASKSIPLPLFSYLYCTLYCSDLALNNSNYSEDNIIKIPSYNELIKLPHPKNTWQVNYIYKLINNENYDKPLLLRFDNLLRGTNYNLKCVFNSTQTINAKKYEFNLNSGDSIEGSNKIMLYTPKVKKLSCVIFKVNKITEDFIKHSLLIIQNQFYESGYKDKGCVVATDPEGKHLNYYFNNEYGTCLSYSNSDINYNKRVLNNNMSSNTYYYTKLYTNSYNNYNRNLQTSKTTYNIDICLEQNKMCSSDINYKEHQVILEQLLNESNSESQSLFRQRLPDTLKENFINYSYLYPNENYSFPPLKISTSSDFDSLKTEALISINFNVNIIASPEDLLCFWILSERPASDTTMTFNEILYCYKYMKKIDDNIEYSAMYNHKNIICGSKKGNIIPFDVSYKVEKKIFEKGKNYSIWVICKQNIRIANLYSSLISEEFSPNYLTYTDNNKNITSNETLIENMCYKGGNITFPLCCPDGKISLTNDSMCYSSRVIIKSSFYLIVFLVLCYISIL